MHNKLFRTLFLNTILFLLNITVIMSLLLIFRIKEIARKMTHKIIWVYETLEGILAQHRADKSSKIQLVYKASSMEINELQLNFNKVATTLSLADRTIDKKENEAALLNYSEAYRIFGEFSEDHSQRGVCLMNIGSIMMRKKDLPGAFQCFNAAIINQHRYMLEIDSNDQQQRSSFNGYSMELKEARFILACRLF